MILEIVTGLLLVLFAIVWALYAVEAFRDSPAQGVLTVVVPAYVLYYAFIRSNRSPYIGLCGGALAVALLVIALF